MPRKKIKIPDQVEYLSILDEGRKVDEKLEPNIPDSHLTDLYRAMLLARRFDERLLSLQRQGRIGTFPPCTGQEASVCGPTAAMTDKDWFVGAFRELGGRLMRGEPIENYILAYGGYEEGNYFDGGERTLVITPDFQKTDAFKDLQKAVVACAKDAFGEKVDLKRIRLPFKKGSDMPYDGINDDDICISV